MTIRPRLLIVPLVAASLSACVIAPYPSRPGVYAQPVPSYSRNSPYYDEGQVVDVAPPAPYVEVVPAIPFVGAIWLGGYWGWNGGRHNWVPGRWEQPRAGYGWRPHAWVERGGRWHGSGGGWYRR